MFTQTKREADRLAYVMGRSYQCQALHGDISQNQRERTLSGFRDGRFNILVATDVAARGLDIPNVDLVSDLGYTMCKYLSQTFFVVQKMSADSFCEHSFEFPPLYIQVVHYEIPNTSELFVHRSGRTARAGKKGSAILIYTYEQTRAVRVIEQDIGCRFTEVEYFRREIGRTKLSNPHEVVFVVEMKCGKLIHFLFFAACSFRRCQFQTRLQTCLMS